MAARLFRLPILTTRLLGHERFFVELTADVRTQPGSTREFHFLFDTGTQFSGIPMAIARSKGLIVPPGKPVTVQGTTGRSPAVLVPVWFCLALVPDLEFPASFSFGQQSTDRCLLSLTDLHTHFTLQTIRGSHLHPNGSLLLRLRRDHGGRPR